MKKSPTPRMTKEEKKLKAMLNYFEIDTGGVRDESESPDKTTKITNQVRNNYDASTMSDIIADIRNNMINRMRQQEEMEEDDDDDFLSGKNYKSNNTDESDIDDLRSPSRSDRNDSKRGNIKKFMTWLNDHLNSADHKIFVTTDNRGTTQIIIQKITGGRSNM